MAADVMSKANHLRQRCKEVMRTLEETDGAPRPNGSMFDHVFDQIPSWFEPFTLMPDTGRLRMRQNRLVQEACKYLNREWPAPAGFEGGGIVNTNPDLGVISTIDENLQGWEGLAARNFRTNYVQKFDGYTKNLYTATYVGYQSLAAVAKLWETAEADVHKLLDDATKAVDAIIGISLGAALELVTTALPSVISIGSAKAGETGLTVIKEIAGTGTKLPPITAKLMTPVDVVEPLRKAVDKLKSDIKAKESEIGSTMAANLAYINGHPREYTAAPVAWDVAYTDPGTDRNGGNTDGQPGTTTLGTDERTG
jgi:hypothetical protein